MHLLPNATKISAFTGVYSLYSGKHKQDVGWYTRNQMGHALKNRKGLCLYNIFIRVEHVNILVLWTGLDILILGET